MKQLTLVGKGKEEREENKEGAHSYQQVREEAPWRLVDQRKRGNGTSEAPQQAGKIDTVHSCSSRVSVLRW
jgi:hypothetical protein